MAIIPFPDDTDPIDRILPRLRGVKPTTNGYLALCPSHHDERPSLSLRRGNNGVALMNCFAGCQFGSILRALGLPESAAFTDDRPPPKPRRSAGPSRFVAEYPYQEADGTVLFEIVRKEPKAFLARRPDGKGGYHWNR